MVLPAAGAIKNKTPLSPLPPPAPSGQIPGKFPLSGQYLKPAKTLTRI